MNGKECEQLCHLLRDTLLELEIEWQMSKVCSFDKLALGNFHHFCNFQLVTFTFKHCSNKNCNSLKLSSSILISTLFQNWWIYNLDYQVYIILVRFWEFFLVVFLNLALFISASRWCLLLQIWIWNCFIIILFYCLNLVFVANLLKFGWIK